MTEALPTFRYHPDPVGTGFLVESAAVCRACERTRAWVYTGPVFAVEELVDELCPWCIADGSAAATFDACFTDVGFGIPDDVAPAVTDEIATRTPGFAGWQQEHWRYHCGDGAAFVGLVGAAELEANPEARASVEAELEADQIPAPDATAILAQLDAAGSPCAYLFRCLHCEQYLASWDCD